MCAVVCERERERECVVREGVVPKNRLVGRDAKQQTHSACAKGGCVEKIMLLLLGKQRQVLVRKRRCKRQAGGINKKTGCVCVCVQGK